MLRTFGPAFRIARGFSTAKLSPGFFEEEIALKADGFFRFQREWKDTRNLVAAQLVSKDNPVENKLTLPGPQRKRATLLQQAILDLSANERELFMIMLSRRAKQEASTKSPTYTSNGQEYQEFVNNLASIEDSIQQQLDPKHAYKLGLLNSLMVHPDALAELAGKLQNDQAAAAASAKPAEAPKVEEAPKVAYF